MLALKPDLLSPSIKFVGFFLSRPGVPFLKTRQQHRRVKPPNCCARAEVARHSCLSSLHRAFEIKQKCSFRYLSRLWDGLNLDFRFVTVGCHSAEFV